MVLPAGRCDAEKTRVALGLLMTVVLHWTFRLVQDVMLGQWNAASASQWEVADGYVRTAG